MVQFTSHAEYRKGRLYFRDASLIESSDTFIKEAEINCPRQWMTFEFDGIPIKYDYKNHKLDKYPELTLTYFFHQQIDLNSQIINLFSFILDIGSGDDYRIFKVHGFFPMTDMKDLTIRSVDYTYH